MPQLFPPEIIGNTVECYHARISTRSKAIYRLNLFINMFKIQLRNINSSGCNFFLPSILSDGRNIPLYSYLAEYKSQLTGL